MLNILLYIENIYKGVGFLKIYLCYMFVWVYAVGASTQGGQKRALEP